MHYLVVLGHKTCTLYKATTGPVGRTPRCPAAYIVCPRLYPAITLFPNIIGQLSSDMLAGGAPVLCCAMLVNLGKTVWEGLTKISCEQTMKAVSL